MLTREMLKDPARINLERRAEPAVGITQAAYPVGQQLKSALLLALLRRGDMKSALVFTRTKHRANRVADWLARQGVRAARIHGNRSQSQRTQALEGFKDGRYQALVATDIAARGIDVEALGHVVNFDVPLASEDYIHRVGRTGRAEATGEAFTFVAPEEEGSLRAIERAIGKPLPRVLLPDFDYRQKPPEAPPPAKRPPASASACRRRPRLSWGDRLQADTGRAGGRLGVSGTARASGSASRSAARSLPARTLGPAVFRLRRPLLVSVPPRPVPLRLASRHPSSLCLPSFLSRSGPPCPALGAQRSHLGPTHPRSFEGCRRRRPLPPRGSLASRTAASAPNERLLRIAFGVALRVRAPPPTPSGRSWLNRYFNSGASSRARLQRYKKQFTASAELRDELERLQELMRLPRQGSDVPASVRLRVS